jgi:hypothetical protein
LPINPVPTRPTLISVISALLDLISYLLKSLKN